MPVWYPNKIFPLAFGDLRLDPNAVAQTLACWGHEQGQQDRLVGLVRHPDDDGAHDALLIKLHRADPAVRRLVDSIPALDHWFLTMAIQHYWSAYNKALEVETL